MDGKNENVDHKHNEFFLMVIAGDIRLNDTIWQTPSWPCHWPWKQDTNNSIKVHSGGWAFTFPTNSVCFENCHANAKYQRAIKESYPCLGFCLLAGVNYTTKINKISGCGLILKCNMIVKDNSFKSTECLISYRIINMFCKWYFVSSLNVTPIAIVDQISCSSTCEKSSHRCLTAWEFDAQVIQCQCSFTESHVKCD